ncbi:CGNR zinc finger domain-containing protein [Rhodococcus sp. NPDC003383]
MVEPRPDNDPVGTAPGRLRWIEEFVNTRRADRDDIATPAQLVDWFHAHDLAHDAASATARQRDRAEHIREGLRALIAGNNAEPVASPRPDGLDPDATARIAALAPSLPMTLDVTVAPPQLIPASRDPIDAALTRLLIAVAEAVADDTWSRLKACREPSCRWAYYDHSRNRRRTWCSMELCGNRAKARTHHRRSTLESGNAVPK